MTPFRIIRLQCTIHIHITHTLTREQMHRQLFGKRAFVPLAPLIRDPFGPSRGYSCDTAAGDVV